MTPRSRFLRIVLAAFAFATLSSAQKSHPEDEGKNTMPSLMDRAQFERKKTGELSIEEAQKAARLNAEFTKALEDAKRLSELADGLKAELEKSNGQVLSVPALKKTEEIEKLAKQIRSRLTRH